MTSCRLTRTLRKCVVPVAVSRCPKPSQSSINSMPSRLTGIRGNLSAPSRAFRMRSISGKGRVRSRSRSLAPSAIRLTSASRSGERRSRRCECSREMTGTGLFMCLDPDRVDETGFSHFRQMIGHLDQLRQNLARDQPVGCFLQIGDELPVVGREMAVLTVQCDELIADLVAVFAGRLRDVLGIPAVLGDPLSFGAESVVDGADQRGIVGRELAGGEIGSVVDLEVEVAAL